MGSDEARRHELVRAASRAAGVLAQDPRVLLVYLFGSARDPSRPVARDLDLALLTAPPLSFDELLRLRADLVLETRAPVDLISLNSAPVVLAREVVDGGDCLYARDPDVETDFVTRTRARYWDFAPYRAEQWRLAGQRIDERLRDIET